MLRQQHGTPCKVCEQHEKRVAHVRVEDVWVKHAGVERCAARVLEFRMLGLSIKVPEPLEDCRHVPGGQRKAPHHKERSQQDARSPRKEAGDDSHTTSTC